MASVPQAVASIDGTFLDANNTFCTLTGFSREEILKKSFFNLTPPQELQATFSVVSELMGRQTSGGGYATRSFKKLCRMRYGVVEVFVSMSVIKNDDDSPAYFTCAVLPVTGTGQEQAAAVGSLAHQSNSSTGSRSVASPAAGESSSPVPLDSMPQREIARGKAGGTAAPSTLPPPAMQSFIVRSTVPTAASDAVCTPGDGFCQDLMGSAMQHLPPQVGAPQHRSNAGSMPGRSGCGAEAALPPQSTSSGTLRMPSIASVDTEAVLTGMQHSSHQFVRAQGEHPAARGAGGVSIPPAGVPVAPPNIFVAPVSNGGVTGNNSIAAFSLGLQDEDWRDEDSFLADMTFDN